MHILRNYRTLAPTKFHGLNQRVVAAVSDTSKISEAVWAANPKLRSVYLETSKKHDIVFHESLLGSKRDIAQREVLQAQLIIYLDEIAVLLELASLYNPEILVVSGFDLSKDRPSHSKPKIQGADTNPTHPAQEGEEAGS
ncbi:hypothetical protein GMST_43930 [Geomonas silvestris]|uniref:Uncharacterized protein n=1 Tax=Geomonas silvestris TaxID=2740184 RepID=A0A6V8MPT7_9BACT|nr:hypothetical protein [Geomonas silvestris]GFO62068.1 hypothetical protein GMST_43930 [Geomonas silvestris]